MTYQNINKTDLVPVVKSAMRYAMGARTYITGVPYSFVKKNQSYWGNKEIGEFYALLSEWLAKVESGEASGGDDCDLATWLKLATYLKNFKRSEHPEVMIISDADDFELIVGSALRYDIWNETEGTYVGNLIMQNLKTWNDKWIVNFARDLNQIDIDIKRGFRSPKTDEEMAKWNTLKAIVIDEAKRRKINESDLYF